MWKVTKKVFGVIGKLLAVVFVAAVVGGLGFLIVRGGPFVYDYFFNAEVVDGFRLIRHGDAVLVVEYSGYDCIAEIPAELDGQPVTQILFIGGERVPLREVTLPDTAQISTGQMNPFGSCVALEKINVSSSNPYYISIDGVLYSKDGKTLVSCPPGKLGTLEVPEGVERIGDFAFTYSLLSAVKLPDSLRAIGYASFLNCPNLYPLEIPAGVEMIDSTSFINGGDMPPARLTITE